MKSRRIEYFAGFFDGEGCVLIVKREAKCEGMFNPAYSIIANVTNTNREVLEAFRTRFEGTIRPYKPDEHHRQWLGKWWSSSLTAYNFLQAVYPYLIVKRYEVAVALELQQSIIKWREGGKGGRIPENIIKYRERLRQDLLDTRKRAKLNNPAGVELNPNFNENLIIEV